jgi:hypothetical protein
VLTRSLAVAALAALLVVGCGSAHPTTSGSRAAAGSGSANPVFDCIAKRAPGHAAVGKTTIAVELPGSSERLIVRQVHSDALAKVLAAKLRAKQASTHSFMVVAAASSRYVIQWGPQRPTVQQGKILIGCVPGL